MLLSFPDLEDPLLQFQFTVEVSASDVSIWGYFTEVSGLGDDQDVIEYKYFDGKYDQVIKVPGRWKGKQVTLKRGLTTSMAFWDWRQLVKNDQLNDARATVTISMYSRAHIEVAVWELKNAWPSSISGPQLNTSTNDFAVEELTLECENIEREQQSLLATLSAML